INDPGLQRMAKYLALKLCNAAWIIILLTLGAIALFPDIHGDRLATSTRSEMQINDGLFDLGLAALERCAWVLRTGAPWWDPDDCACTGREQSLIGLMPWLGSTFLGRAAGGLGG